MYDPLILLALAGAGFLAGFVDAIAGGGGMISVPALMSAGLPPVAALATNKFQGIIGTAMAVVTYWRRGFVSLPMLGISAIMTFIGSVLGALVVSRIDVSALNIAVPAALIVIAGYFLFAPRLGDTDRAARLPLRLALPVVGFVLGFYDGIFGPGTGSFFTMAFVTLFGFGMTRAAGNTKALNFLSNLGALVFFMISGEVVWPVALVMAIGQIAGGYIGARTGIRFGARLIRPLVIIVSIIMAAKLLIEQLS